jgi:hemerythrin-like domain-containing protein
MFSQIQTMHKEHSNFAKLLDLLEARLCWTPGGEEPDYALMLDVMDYMTHYPDRFHHPREDLAFRRLQRRRPDTRSVVAQLVRQHQAIAATGFRLAEELATAIKETAPPREALARSANLYIAALRANIQLEETELFPLAAQLLQADDWLLIDAAFHFREDPLFGSPIEERYRALHRHIARQVGCGCIDAMA